jgi:hypothetical protein
MTDVITVTMPYFADVSVNRYKTRGGRIKRAVWNWREALRMPVRVAHNDVKKFTPPIYVGIEILTAARGRLPDQENFRKIIHDAVSGGLGIDDQQFVAWQEMSPPARRPTGNEQSAIIVRVRGS